VNATTSSPMSKRKTPKAWVAYKIAKIGKRLGTEYGETEKEALANAQKEFAKTEGERKRIYLREQRRAVRNSRQRLGAPGIPEEP
jgi:hypothetical protein